MKNSHMQRDPILVVDVEATCWEKLPPPPGQQHEIIEVGLCLLNVETGELSGKRSILVKPERSKVSAFCTQLTTLTQEQVDTGIQFEAACAILETEYRSAERLWASWGDYDRKIFKSQCVSFEVRYPFGEKHVNLKKLFAKLHRYQRVGMAKALEMTGLTPEGTQHRGDDDAWNGARLLQFLLQKHGDGILRKYW